uniref:Uncharacterized protein n=1 Tax=Bionectria ochroleuca TaxID=29856 RepID=A0A8H7NHK8_BIOOC
MSNKVIAHIDTPDPWMVQANGVYYLTFTLANRIEIWESPLMEDFFNARKALVWQPEPGSRWAADIWAPELHLIKGVWYIYATASQPGVGNPGHRTIVLRSARQDPMEEAAWEFLGPLKGMPEAFSIDATVFSPNGEDPVHLLVRVAGRRQLGHQAGPLRDPDDLARGGRGLVDPPAGVHRVCRPALGAVRRREARDQRGADVAQPAQRRVHGDRVLGTRQLHERVQAGVAAAGCAER